MSIINATFIDADVNRANANVIYWFDVEYKDTTDELFERENFGVVEHDGKAVRIVDAEGYPIDGYQCERFVQELPSFVTDKMRKEA